MDFHYCNDSTCHILLRGVKNYCKKHKKQNAQHNLKILYNNRRIAQKHVEENLVLEVYIK